MFVLMTLLLFVGGLPGIVVHLLVGAETVSSVVSLDVLPVLVGDAAFMCGVSMNECMRLYLPGFAVVEP
jgi:hypothetical protein